MFIFSFDNSYPKNHRHLTWKEAANKSFENKVKIDIMLDIFKLPKNNLKKILVYSERKARGIVNYCEKNNIPFGLFIKLDVTI